MAKSFTAARNFRHNGETIKKGGTVSLSKEDGAALARRGFVKADEPAPTSTSGSGSK
jgi:hypothetical protein